jgi:DNA gyrase/topoisomerase IV subunit A
MKRLSKFEVESLVNVVMSKLEKIESQKIEKIEKECSKKISEWNKELLELDKEKEIISRMISKKNSEIEGEIRKKGWKGLYVNEWSSSVKIEKCDLVSYEVRSKIMDEIVINSLKENDIDSLLDSLVDKFKK